MLVDDEFIDRILEGEASDEEAAEFQGWMKTPANLERFALRAELHSDLRRSLRRRHIQTSALEACPDGTVTDSTSPQETAASLVLHSRQMLVLTVTGLATAACILFTIMQPEGNSDPAPADGSAATVVSNVNGLLTKGKRQWHEAKLPIGDYELQKGLLHLQFGGGVMVYVEAPARFDAVSKDRVVLHSGRLSATVPNKGIGFTVETPEAEVVDFGTEFSVDVEGGASEVHVFDGLVRVHPGASDQRDTSKSVDLQASQAVRIADGATEAEDISIATDRFIRNFDELSVSYSAAVRRLSPAAYYRMPIRKGLRCHPPIYSGQLLTGEGARPPRGPGFMGGSLRVQEGSSGRGARVDQPPPLDGGQFTLIVSVSARSRAAGAVVATNMNGDKGCFALSLDDTGRLTGTIRKEDGELLSCAGTSPLPLEPWQHIALSFDGQRLRLFENGAETGKRDCDSMAKDSQSTLWFGTDATSTRMWDGRIDELALFDLALNPERIADLHRVAYSQSASKEMHSLESK